MGADRIQVVLSASVPHIIQDRILEVGSSATFIFSWCDILKIYWTALKGGIRSPFKLRNACCWHQQDHYLFISLSLFLRNCTTKILQFGSRAVNVHSFFYQSLDVCCWRQNNTKDYRSVFALKDNILVFLFGKKKGTKSDTCLVNLDQLLKILTKWKVSTLESIDFLKDFIQNNSCSTRLYMFFFLRLFKATWCILLLSFFK